MWSLASRHHRSYQGKGSLFSNGGVRNDGLKECLLIPWLCIQTAPDVKGIIFRFFQCADDPSAWDPETLSNVRPKGRRVVDQVVPVVTDKLQRLMAEPGYIRPRLVIEGSCEDGNKQLGWKGADGDEGAALPAEQHHTSFQLLLNRSYSAKFLVELGDGFSIDVLLVRRP